MSRYDYSDPSLDPSYCDGLAADDTDEREYRCLWCDRLLSVADASDYCSALCANYALIDSGER
jgi:hypothetical protein